MTFLCEICDREILDNLPRYLYKESDSGNKIKNYTVDNIKLDEVEETIKNYITIYNGDYDIYFFNYKFKLEFENNVILNIETNYIHNIESEKITNTLLYIIKCHELKGYKFCRINQMNILILIDKCNITYKNYINSPMPMVERRINFIIAKNPILINSFDRSKNHPLIKKYSHIPFTNI